MWVLWGFKGADMPPIKITGGSLPWCRAEAKFRRGVGWTCAIYSKGTAPEGLRAVWEALIR